MFRRLAAVFASLLVAFAIASPASPAAAAPPQGCLTSYVCMYAGTNYTGYSTFWSATAAANLGCHSLYGTPLNNNIESVYGNYVGAGKWIGYFNSHNCTGTIEFGSSGGAYPDLGPDKNIVSSFRIQNLP